MDKSSQEGPRGVEYRDERKGLPIEIYDLGFLPWSEDIVGGR